MEKVDNTSGYYLKISKNESKLTVEESVVFIDDSTDKLTGYYEAIDVSSIDHVYLDLGHCVELIVDDIGLLVDGNMVFEVNFDGKQQLVAGAFLVGRCVETIEGDYAFAGFKTEQDLRTVLEQCNLSFNLYGIIRG